MNYADFFGADQFRSRERQERDQATIAGEAEKATVHRLSADWFSELRVRAKWKVHRASLNLATRSDIPHHARFDRLEQVERAGERC